jgi:hypothetical protein
LRLYGAQSRRTFCLVMATMRKKDGAAPFFATADRNANRWISTPTPIIRPQSMEAKRRTYPQMQIAIHFGKGTKKGEQPSSSGASSPSQRWIRGAAEQRARSEDRRGARRSSGLLHNPLVAMATGRMEEERRRPQPPEHARWKPQQRLEKKEELHADQLKPLGSMATSS